MEGAEWVGLPVPSLGRYRVSSQATIIFRSDGLHNNGYALCLCCGRAESMPADDELPDIFMDKKGGTVPHKRLRGGRNNDRETECPGSSEPWAIKRNLRLGVTRRTEVLELQLQDTFGNPIDRATAYTTGVALRRALAARLGVEEREVGVAISSTRGKDGRSTYSIFLFDTASGGAGYVSQAIQWLSVLFHKAREILLCPRDCDVACQGCLLSYDTQHHIQDLDRNKALALIDERFLLALRLPAEMQVFGPKTVLEMEPLSLALRRERQRLDVNEVRIFLGGDVKEWEPLAWRSRNELLGIHETGAKIRLIVPQRMLGVLEPSQCDELAAMATLVQAEIYCPETGPIIVDGRTTLPRALEIGGSRSSVQWAASNQAALAPNPQWGGDVHGAQFVRVINDGPLEPLPQKWLRRIAADLRPAGEDTFSIPITNELDGQLQHFGERAWKLLGDRSPNLKRKLAEKQPLVSI